MKYFLAILIAGIAFLGGMLYTNETRASATAQTPNAISDSMATQDVDSRCLFYSPGLDEPIYDTPPVVYVKTSDFAAFPVSSVLEPCSIFKVANVSLDDDLTSKMLEQAQIAMKAAGGNIPPVGSLEGQVLDGATYVNLVPLANGAVFVFGVKQDLTIQEKSKINPFADNGSNSGTVKPFTYGAQSGSRQKTSFFGVYVLKEK